ncbi:MAG: hypothetical protein ACRC46_10185 [Thermoguttaceae bacterium]
MLKNFAILFASTICGVALAAPIPNDVEKTRERLVERGVAFLRDAQTPDGAWSPQVGIGPTAVVVKGLLDSGVATDDPMLAKGLAFLTKSVQADGGIYTAGGSYQNYETCLAMMCLAAADEIAAKSPNGNKYKETLSRAETYVRKNQFTDENENLTKETEQFRGGAGYGEHKRPDLSNTHFFIEALRSVGRGGDDPAIQKALVFVSRCQNLESEHNTLSFATKNPDGGFIYSCADETSKAGETSEGGLRSYASMTYAGLKSLLYAGVTKDDRRVRAAREWIAKHYDVTTNPGMGQSGLFYYYQVMAKSLGAIGSPELISADGTKHLWRNDLIAVLAEKQNSDGSWSNPETRWLEGDPNLVTGYVLIVLADCK